MSKINRKHLIGALGVIIAAVAVVMALAWISLKPISNDAGFNRNFIREALSLLYVASKPTDIMDVAGATKYNIYFKTKDPRKVFVTSQDLKQNRYLNLSIPDNGRIASRFSVIVDSPNTTILAGNVPAIFKIREGSTYTTYKAPDALFTRTARISDNSFAIRMFEGRDQIFVKYDLNNKTTVKENNISEKKKDAGISTDGTLQYDKKNNLILYICYYKNEVLFIDTNMNLVKKKELLDAKNLSLAIPEATQGEKSITSLTPKRLINAQSIISDGHLFNQSKVRSDNESVSDFAGNSIIDIYDVYNWKQIGSFHIPNYNGERMFRFTIINDKVLVIYKSHIALYQLPALPVKTTGTQ